MNYTIPKHKSGGKSQTIVKKSFDSASDAQDHFATVRERFYDINNWYYELDKKMSKFFLCNASGNHIQSHPEKGNLIRINIQGPENADGNEDDWVHISFIDEEENDVEVCCIIEVKPCKAPKNCDKEVAHFYDKEASNSFILKRKDKDVILEIHGRNEHINDDSSSLLGKIRNIFMALGGILGGSKTQWDILAENLMEVS